MAAGTANRVTFTPDSVRDFRRVLNEVVAVTKRDLPGIIRWAAVKFLQSARANTMVSRKLRDTRTDGGKTQMEVWAQGWAAPRWHDISGMSDPARIIARRGAARNSWNRCFRDLGKTPGGTPGYQPPPGSAEARDRTGAAAPEVEVTNRISYLDIIHPTIMDDSLNRVRHQYEAMLTRQAIRALQHGVGVGKLA